MPGSTTLAVDPAGIELLRSLGGVPVAPVVVIGPYRSGKSFLLNQLLGVGCASGFGVGHTRATQTKGVWVWGDPRPMAGEGGGFQLHIDTEGFESTGQSDAYDDRIFALASVVASVLVYNLPEAVRESDIEKLGFATQIADALFSSAKGGDASASASASPPPRPPPPIRPGAMLWLIQRDFLGGDSPQQALDAALAAVPNPGGDAAIDRLNRVRDALKTVASSSTAAGLPQPHLDRTALCELGDDALAPAYLRARADVAVREREREGKGWWWQSFFFFF